MRCKHTCTGKTEYDLISRKKNFTCKALIVTFKKTFYNFFPGLFSVFQTFSRSGKLLGKFKEPFQEFKTLYEP